MRKKSRTEYSVLNIITGLGGYALNTVLGLVCRMVFTRTLSAEYLGVSGLFTNILSMLSLAELGIGSAIVYALYKPLAVDDKEKVASLVKFYGQCYRVIGVVVAVIGVALMPFLHLLIDEPNIQENIYLLYGLYLFNAASTYFFSYRASLLMAAQQNYIVTGVNYIITVAQSVLQIIWLFATHHYIGYLIIQCVCVFIYNIVVSYIARKEYPYIAEKISNRVVKLRRGFSSGTYAPVCFGSGGGWVVIGRARLSSHFSMGLQQSVLRLIIRCCREP